MALCILFEVSKEKEGVTLEYLLFEYSSLRFFFFISSFLSSDVAHSMVVDEVSIPALNMTWK